MVWTPGKGGSKEAKDYYREKQAEYGRRPDVSTTKQDTGGRPDVSTTKQDTGGKFPSKKEWYAEKGDPTQHKSVNEIQRLTEKWASKGKDFTKTQQYKGMHNDLYNITVNKGGFRGKIWDNDPTLNTGHKIGDDYRRSLLSGTGPGVQGIKDINPQTARLGLENDPDQFFRFNQQLMEKNPVAYETARPWSSGKGVRDVIGLTGPGKILTELGTALGDIPEALGDLGGAAKEGLAKIFPGPAKDFGAEWERLQSNFPWNRGKDKTDEVVTDTLDAITDPRESIYTMKDVAGDRAGDVAGEENIFTEQIETFKDPAQTQTIESIMKDNTLSPWQKRMAIEDVSGYSDAIQHMDKKQGLGGFDEPEALQSLLTEYSNITGGDLMRGAGHPSPTQYMTDAEKTAFQDSIGATAKEADWEHYDDEGYGFGQFGDQFSQGDQLSELGLPMDMGWQKDPYEKLSLEELINLGASQEQIADYLNISQAAGGGLASIDPYRGTLGGGMNPSGRSPDPTVRSVTGYQNGGLMNNGNPVNYNNLRNTNKYYGSF